MGNINKANPVGIDDSIQSIQNSVYEEFFTQFGSSWNSYGRVYRNYSEDGKCYEPSPYLGNGEYILDNFFDDKTYITSFFDIGEKIKYNEDNCNPSAKAVFYFFCSNVPAVLAAYNSANGVTGAYDRQDEVIMQQITTFMQLQFGFVLQFKRLGINTVMKDWIGKCADQVKTQNQQPFFCFSLEFSLSEYSVNYNNYALLGIQQASPLLIPYTRYNATGIDQWIEYLQIGIFNYLLIVFSGNYSGYNQIKQKNYNQFGRVYRNSKKKEYVHEAFVKLASTGNFDYVDTFFNDTVAIQSFFDIGEAMREDPDSGFAYSIVNCYFFIDLSQLFTSSSERMDEEIIILITNFFFNCYGFVLTDVVRGIKSIFDEYSGFKIKKNKLFNKQPHLAFRIGLKKYYDESWNNCPILIPDGGSHEFAPQEFDDTEFA